MGFFKKQKVEQHEFQPVEDEQLFVGESFYQEELAEVLGTRGHTTFNQVSKRISEDFTADLVPEPNNKYDRNAVAVYIDGKKVAHLSRENAENYRAAFGTAQGQVEVCVWVKAKSHGMISVWPK